MRRVLVGVVAAATGLVPFTVLTSAPADAGARVHQRLRAAVHALPVAAEHHAGYQRAKFRLWVDANGDCQNTRAEVLVQESKVRTRGCHVTRGKWYSYYDNRTWRSASRLDIDHVVPLAEAWDSGARRWNAATRQRYANDLGDRRTLVAVTSSVNRSKGAKDPARWLPRYGKCRYVRDWVAVKTRWSLTVNPAEKATLTRIARRCPNTYLTVRKAAIGRAGRGTTPNAALRITRVVYDAPGRDSSRNENGEIVVIRNAGRKAASTNGWRLRDVAGHVYRFPAHRIASGQTLTVHSGHGRTTRYHVYAGWGHVWNNTGDTAVLVRPGGRVADRCSWGDGSGSTRC